LYSVNQFKEEQYISCVTQEPRLSLWRYAYYMFDMMLNGTYKPSWLISRCVYVHRVSLFYLLFTAESRVYS